MIKGGQQFFSNYLSAFKDTVDKLTELVDLTEQIVPKYAVLSNNVKYEVDKLGAELISIDNTNPNRRLLISNVSGKIKIGLYIKGTSTSMDIYINGVKRNRIYEVNNTAYKLYEVETIVLEGDEITIQNAETSKFNYINKIIVSYDLAQKPEMLI